MITSFIGVIGSGKDYHAEQLAESGALRVDFKDGLLDMASDIAGYNVREDYEWFKENIVGVKRPPNRFQEAFIYTDKRQIFVENPELMTGRRLLQRLGTDTMRKRDEDYWVNQFISAVGFHENVVNADCRFRNEVNIIYKLDPQAKFIFCDYRSSRYDPTSTHPSEHLAQCLLEQGLKDGDAIHHDNFFEAFFL